MAGEGLQEVGAAWLEESDVDLDRFLQEDALLDAIQNVPGLEELERLEQEQQRQQPLMAPFAVNGAGASGFVSSSSSTSAAERDASLCMDTTSLLRGHTGAEEPSFGGGSSGTQAPAVSRRSGATSVASPSAAGGAPAPTPRAGVARVAHGARPPPGGNSAAAGAPGGAAAAAAAALPRKRPVPWRGAALLVVAIWSIIYFGLGLFESDEPGARPLVPVLAAEPKPIQMPGDLPGSPFGGSAGEAANGTSAASPAVRSAGTLRRGKIEVRWSSDSAASNTSGAAAMPGLSSQGGNSSGSEASGGGDGGAAGKRGDRGRRGRGPRGRSGDMGGERDLLR